MIFIIPGSLNSNPQKNHKAKRIAKNTLACGIIGAGVQAVSSLRTYTKNKKILNSKLALKEFQKSTAKHIATSAGYSALATLLINGAYNILTSITNNKKRADNGKHKSGQFKYQK